jgi:hypothetical protein
MRCREAFDRLQLFRSRFEGLLASVRQNASSACTTRLRRPTELRELFGFGANPGNLRMFAYTPERLPHKAPLVIALHGCTQTAGEYDHGTGWSVTRRQLWIRGRISAAAASQQSKEMFLAVFARRHCTRPLALCPIRRKNGFQPDHKNGRLAERKQAEGPTQKVADWKDVRYLAANFFVRSKRERSTGDKVVEEALFRRGIFKLDVTPLRIIAG